MRAQIAHALRCLACRIGGHDPSELDGLMIGSATAVCRCCKREVET
jgi:hypothetical protein